MITFFHGLESGPYGSKYDHLCMDFGGAYVSSVDFRRLDKPTHMTGIDNVVQERLEKAELVVTKPTLIVGSSMGALIAGLFASRHPELVTGLVFCAPAFHRPEAAQITAPTCPAACVAASQDDIVPPEVVLRECARLGVPVTIVDDSHRLIQSRSVISEAVAKVLAQYRAANVA